MRFLKPVFTPVFAALIALGLGQVTDARATVVNDSNVGLAAPDKLIDFGSFLFPGGTPITNQFAADGVTFGSNYRYFTTSSVSPAITGGYLAAVDNNVQPGSILFTSAVRDAVFSWRTSTGTSTFSAWLGGVLQEQATLATSANHLLTGRYYGFTGIVFDEIRLSISAATTDFSLDNLQYNVAPVPLPAPLLLLGTALAGLAGATRVRRRAV